MLGRGPYMLFLYRRVIMGRLAAEHLRAILDLSPRELLVFAPLVAVTIWMGVWPGPFLDATEASVANLVERHVTAMRALEGVAVAGR